jgi:hypothetical protein
MEEEELKRHYEHIKHYLRSDIEGLIEADESGKNMGCGLYLLVACSGIDFFGNLYHPGKELRNVRHGKGFKLYVEKFMGQVNPIYRRNRVSEFLYERVRCGQIHEAIAKPPVRIGKGGSKIEHLTYENSSKKSIYFDVKIFAEDLLKSLEFFEKVFEKPEELRDMSDRLQRHIDKLTAINPDLKTRRARRSDREYEVTDSGTSYSPVMVSSSSSSRSVDSEKKE